MCQKVYKKRRGSRWRMRWRRQQEEVEEVKVALMGGECGSGCKVMGGRTGSGCGSGDKWSRLWQQLDRMGEAGWCLPDLGMESITFGMDEKAHQAVNRDIYGTNVPEKEDIARVMSLEECEILLGKRKKSEISKTEWRDSITRQVYLLLQPYRKKEEDSHLVDLVVLGRAGLRIITVTEKGKPMRAFPSSAMEGGDSNWLFMIAKAVAALTLQAMAYAGFCTLEKLLPESACNIVREINGVVRFVLSVFDMEDFERIYELSIIEDEYSTYYSNLCHANCDPNVAVAEGKVKVEKFSTLREHDICDIIQQCQGCAENKGFEGRIEEVDAVKVSVGLDNALRRERNELKSRMEKG
ncbi:unnamed protein product [Camellia sinensis]